MMRKFAVACILCCVVFAACNISVSDEEYTAKIFEIDVFVSNGSKNAAVRRLKTLSKRVFGIDQRLGIYRRLTELGEIASAEKALVAWLKQQPDSPELNAVQVWSLIEQKRFEEASIKADSLRATPFKTLTGELYFRKVLSENYDNPASIFKDVSPDMFYSIYIGTKGEAALANAAALYAANGEIERAATLPYSPRLTPLPAKLLLFWGVLLLDAGYVPEALEYIEATVMNSNEAGRLESLALQADALGNMGNVDAAQSVREEIFRDYERRDIPPVIFYNNARYAKLHGDVQVYYASLKELVQNSPDYAPGLAAYGALAFEKPPESPARETGLEDDLRRAGLTTLQMQAVRNAAVSVPVEPVVQLMAESVKRTQSIAVLVEYFKFIQQLREQNGDTDRKFAWLWDALEENLTDNTYSPELAHYAVSFLFVNEQAQLGTELFERYFRFRYNGADPLAILPKIATWEIETLAWIAAERGDSGRAIQLYRYLCDAAYEPNPLAVHEYRYKPPQHIFVNLAELEQGTGHLAEAVALYKVALEIVPETAPRYEILYRLGKVQFDNREFRQATFSLEECLALNPNYQKARMLMRQMTEK
jgi:tetratricopeptide (TPR) repeat protein